jgi:hypothetical protein
MASASDELRSLVACLDRLDLPSGTEYGCPDCGRYVPSESARQSYLDIYRLHPDLAAGYLRSCQEHAPDCEYGPLLDRCRELVNTPTKGEE